MTAPHDEAGEPSPRRSRWLVRLLVLALVLFAVLSITWLQLATRVGGFKVVDLAILVVVCLSLSALLLVGLQAGRDFVASSSTRVARRLRAYGAAADAAIESEEQHQPRVPRVHLPLAIVVIAAVILAVNVVMLFAGAYQTGIGVDEPVHVVRLQQWLTSGWYIPDFLLSGGESTLGDTYVYAPVAALVAHLVTVLGGAEGLTEVAITPEAYTIRQFAIGMFSLVGLAGAAMIARLVFRSWRWGVLAAAVLSAIPMWTGHGMFNIKDTPVAAGYTVFTLGLVLLSRPVALTRGRQRSLAMAAIATGLVIAVGTRPGMWPALTGSAVVAIIAVTVLTARSVDRRTALLTASVRTLIYLASGLIAYLVLLAIYPNAFSRPFSVAVLSIGESAGYGYATKAPSDYLPLWFSNQIPVVILGIALFGLLVSLIGLIRALLVRRARRSTQPPERRWGLQELMVPVLAQALLMPVMAIVIRPTIYDAMRQFLFIIPAWAIITGVGIWWLTRAMSGAGVGRLAGRIVIGVLVAVALVMPTFDQFRLFPYNYTYFNEIATMQPINGRWATDYWRLSERELARKVDLGPSGLCPYGYAKGPVDWRPERILGYPTCRSNENFTVFRSVDGPSEQQPKLSPTQFWYTIENRSGYHMPENCRLADEVTRPLRGQTLMMSLAAICDLRFPELPNSQVIAARTLDSSAFVSGWALPPRPGGVWSTGTSARLGVMLPKQLRDQDVQLTVDGHRLVPRGEERRVDLWVNDVPLVGAIYGGDSEDQRIEVTVPADVAGKMGEGRMIVTFRTPDPVPAGPAGIGGIGHPVGFLLNAIGVAPARSSGG